jgi:hypothetical protein
VTFGAPYRVQPEPGVSLKIALQTATEEMARRITELLPEGYRGVYATAQGSEALEETASP